MVTSSEARRDAQVGQALKRFARNRNRPEELETLRYNLIVARVLSGMTQPEAAERLGCSDPTEIERIESGVSPTPRDHHFLRRASQVYMVSSDFLLGLSPHTEFDSRVAQQHALMRGTEQVLSGIAAQFASAMIQFTRQTQPVPDDFIRVSAAAEKVARALAVMREKYGLDDLRGSAPLVAAVGDLSRAVEPLRQKVKCYRAIDAYFDELRAGKLQPIPYLTERYGQQELGLDG